MDHYLRIAPLPIPEGTHILRPFDNCLLGFWDDSSVPRRRVARVPEERASDRPPERTRP
jgi:hypothetical protein